MSEATFPLKKAIPIIAVTWMLSLITTLAFVYVVPNVLRPTWHEVATFSGSGNQPTEVFYVSSDHWRIHWHASPDPLTEDTSFWLWVHKYDTILPSFDLGTLTASDFDDAFLNMPGGVEYITGSGRFQIEVLAESAEWEITVEAYH